MKIDEALEIAQGNIAASIRKWDKGGDPEIITMHAAIAQAAALTAQAMDFHRYVEAWIAMGDLVDTTEYNDPAEVADATLYDAYRAEWERQEREKQA